MCTRGNIWRWLQHAMHLFIIRLHLATRHQHMRCVGRSDLIKPMLLKLPGCILGPRAALDSIGQWLLAANQLHLLHVTCQSVPLTFAYHNIACRPASIAVTSSGSAIPHAR